MPKNGANPLPDIILLSSTETVALIRDISVIVFLIFAVIALIIFMLYVHSLYRRVTRVLDAADKAIARLESVAGAARNVGNILSFGGAATRIFGRFRRP
jgi:hypothetical protein